MGNYSLATIVIAIVAIIGVWFLIRELVTWYYKINKIVSLLEANNELLSEISQKIAADEKPVSKDPSVWECPKCKTNNSNESFQCSSCGYKLQ